jgi:hypothetical protein
MAKYELEHVRIVNKNGEWQGRDLQAQCLAAMKPFLSSEGGKDLEARSQ